MSSSKGSSNSNKTAHVMNLLRKSNPSAQSQTVNAEVPPTSTATSAAVPAKPAASAAPVPQVPPILTSLHADAEVSAQIRDALADALEDELKADGVSVSQPEPIHPPVQEISATPPEEAVPESNLAVDSSDLPASIIEPAETIQEPVEEITSESTQAETIPAAPAETDYPVEKTAPIGASDVLSEGSSAAEENAPTASTPAPIEDSLNAAEDNAASSSECESSPAPVSDDVDFINVTKELTEDKVDKYIQLFGLCACPRCKQDVLALALNHLLPKYVVMNRAEFRILRDMYASRYSAEITAQLLWACKTVMDNPRH